MSGDSPFEKNKKKPHVVKIWRLVLATRVLTALRRRVERARILERTAVAARRGSVYQGRDLAHGELLLAF